MFEMRGGLEYEDGFEVAIRGVSGIHAFEQGMRGKGCGIGGGGDGEGGVRWMW